MKKNLWSLPLIPVVFFIAELFFLVSCVFKFDYPTLSTIPVTHISYSSGFSGGIITDDGGSLVTAYGVCYSTAPNPTIEDKTSGCVSYICGHVKTEFARIIEALDVNTMYYVRAYAQNSKGLAYGSQVSFTTLSFDKKIYFNPKLSYGSLSDIDGNTYKSIQIGSQVWMAQNLMVTRFSNGNKLQNNTGNWEKTDTAGEYCENGNNDIYSSAFGYLYNYYSIIDKRELCPTGWHVPTDTDWTILESYLGEFSEAGSKLKETGTSHWIYPNTDATNESGFTALPAGYHSIGILAAWWSRNNTITSSVGLCNVNGILSRDKDSNIDYAIGYSVRCVKN